MTQLFARSDNSLRTYKHACKFHSMSSRSHPKKAIVFRVLSHVRPSRICIYISLYISLAGVCGAKQHSFDTPFGGSAPRELTWGSAPSVQRNTCRSLIMVSNAPFVATCFAMTLQIPGKPRTCKTNCKTK